MKSFIFFIITIGFFLFQIGLIDLKTSGVLTCGWGVVLLPMYMILVFIVYNAVQEIKEKINAARKD